jgi:hypothetical protein
MQKKMDQQCHCEGAVGDCGNLKPYSTKTVYFLRRPQNVAVAISGITIEIAALGYASLAMTMASDFLSETLLCAGRQMGHPKNIGSIYLTHTLNNPPKTVILA